MEYESSILPALERTAEEAARAHRRGQVGYATVLGRLGPLFEARAEHLELVWRHNELVLDLEEVTGEDFTAPGGNR
jgi:hypothetical protein